MYTNAVSFYHYDNSYYLILFSVPIPSLLSQTLQLLVLIKNVALYQLIMATIDKQFMA